MAKLPTITVSASIKNKAADIEVMPVFHDEKKKILTPKGPYFKTIKAIKQSGVFSAKPLTFDYIKEGGKRSARHVIFAGLGQLSKLTEEKARQSGGAVLSKIIAEKPKSLVLNLDEFRDRKFSRSFIEGLLLAYYSYDKYKSKTPEKQSLKKILLVSGDKNNKDQLQKELKRITAIVESVWLARDWGNEPSNMGTPQYYAEEAVKLAKQFGLKHKVLSGKEIKEEKMGLFFGVSQGAAQDPKLVVLEYEPSAKATKTIAFVGKGVTFDSGGISIKPSTRMEEMKYDMCGAAAVMGAIALASKLKVRNKIIAVLALTENMPDGKALQPGNILRSRAGKTVEVVNTDAEGRLILADAIDYVQEKKPDVIIDVATLTGAVSIALGKYCGAILGNDQAVMDLVQKSSKAVGERIWQLPLFDEYFDDLKSDHADMKNSANDGHGGTIRGAAFIKQFVKKSTKWAHLDIAATSYHQAHLQYHPKRGASGSYVRTLAQFAQDFE